MLADLSLQQIPQMLSANNGIILDSFELALRPACGGCRFIQITVDSLCSGAEPAQEKKANQSSQLGLDREFRPYFPCQ